MLVQIPIFFGFFNMLNKAVELRNSSFSGCNDLPSPTRWREFSGSRSPAPPGNGGDDGLADARLAEERRQMQQRIMMFSR